MTEPLTPPTDPYKQPASAPEPTTAPIQPPADHSAAAQPITDGTQPYPSTPAFPAPQAFPTPSAYQPGQAPMGSGTSDTTAPISGYPAAAPTSGYPAAAPTSGYPAAAPTSGYPAAAPTSGYPAQPGYPQTAPQGYPAYGQPGYPAAGYPMPEAPKKKSKAPMIIGIVLGVLLLLCGGGGLAAFLIFQNKVDPLGAGYDTPKTATNAFLNAFYVDKDPARAEETVCKQSRVKKDIDAQIERIAGYYVTYNSPKFTWDITVSDENAETAKADVKLTMTTGDEKVSTQNLSLVVTKLDGWRVCDVKG